MIACKNVSFAYPAGTGSEDAPGGRLKNITLEIAGGEFVLLCGASGCGKTTLTRLFNGLIPHYYEGSLSGTVTLDGEALADMSLFDISARVGSVFQNPQAQFFNVDTTAEVAFGPENHGLPEATIRARVDQVAEELALGNLLGRSIFSLSGGEKQKIACASAAAVEPDVMVLDEPSSNLDADAIGDLRELLAIFKGQGKTVIIAEHRLYYLWDLADRVIFLREGEIAGDYTAAEFAALGEAQREAMGLRPLRLDALAAVVGAPAPVDRGAWQLENFRFAYRGARETLAIDSAALPAGQVTAIIGHNGAGKSTFSRCLCGLEKRCHGEIILDKMRYTSRGRLKQAYMVMQDVNHQLFTDTVIDEVLLSLPDTRADGRARAEALLAAMDLLPYRDHHPLGLSGGQKQRVAIASALASARPMIIFDEPTSGLDLFHMRQVAEAINALAAEGKTIVIVTHDPEFILRCCQHVLHLEAGRIHAAYELDAAGRRQLLDFFMAKGGAAHGDA